MTSEAISVLKKDKRYRKLYAVSLEMLQKWHI